MQIIPLKFRFNYILTLALILCGFVINAQEENNTTHNGIFNAYLHTQVGIFVRDSTIGASGTPQYDRQLFGSETWLNMNYSNWGMEFGLRADFFQNSNLINPQASFNKQGIGRWYVKRDQERIGFEAGYIYDQIGSGIIYRAYEQRNLGLDNALYGLKLNYDLNDQWHVKAFSGKQKRQFDTYESLIKGIGIEGFIQTHDTSTWSLAPGFAMVNRTLDDASMTNVLATVASYQKEDQFFPKHNDYAFTFYNQTNFKNFSWYVETAWRNKNIINNPMGSRKTSTGESVLGPVFKNNSGSVIYSSINFVRSNWSLSVEGKRTDFFSIRTRPQEEFNNGLIHFVPAMSRLNSYRLLSFYQPATQEIGELAFQAELQWSPKDGLNLLAHHSNINDLNGQKLYREFLLESTLIKHQEYSFILGVQMQEYNQEVYQGKPNAPIVNTFTPYVDFTRQLSDQHSLRVDMEYMYTKKDEGSWANLLLEYSIAPRWIFSVSDMYNIKPVQGSKRNYYTIGATYSKDVHRFSANWVRQRAGIVCTGGICRFEPAFNGLRFSFESRF